MRAVTLAALLGLSAVASAQSARDRQGAADAFDRGSAAYLAEDFTAAARWFEMANNLAPAAPALLQAVRAHLRADNTLRAGTLALRLVATWPDAEREVTTANEVIDTAQARFFRIDVTCDAECAVEIDGALSSHPSFFVEPGQEHTIGASFESGSVSESVEGAEGEQRELSFERPEGPALDPVNQDPPDDTGPTVVPPDRGTPPPSGGIHPAVFITSLVLTAGAGAVLVWSGLDTLSINDDYEAAAAEELSGGRLDFPRSNALLDDGQSAEKRTNALIGVTAGLAAVTILTVILTDWGGEPDDDEQVTLRPSLGIGPQGGGVGLGGTF